MSVSRVQKFKDYRNSLIKEETPVLETPKSSPKTEEIKASQKETTSTLPMDEVIETLQDDESEAVFLRKRRLKKSLWISVIALIALVVIGGIVIFGIIVWR